MAKEINLSKVSEEITYCFVCPNCEETVESTVELEIDDTIDCVECKEIFTIIDG